MRRAHRQRRAHPGGTERDPLRRGTGGDSNRRDGYEAENDVCDPAAARLEAVRLEGRHASRRNPMQLDELSDN